MKFSQFQYFGVPLFAASVLVNASTIPAFAESDIQTVRIGWCTQTLNVTAAPLAIAEKMGWFEEGGVKVHLVPLPGSADCARNVATGEIDAAVAAPEPIAVLRTQGVDLKVFYTAYRRNIFGLAVPQSSDIQTYNDLRGKKIGVTSMSSVGVIIARSVAADAGLNPDSDIRIVVSGEPAQSASLLRSGEVAALSQWDTNYLLVERAGVPMRRIEDQQIASFPSNSLVALQSTFEKKSKELAAVARGYAMGTVFAIENPAAASEIMYELHPDIRPTGLDPETVRAIDMKTLAERARVWALEDGQRWGESNPEIYQRYVEWLQKWGIVKGEVKATDMISNEFLDEINNFDPSEVKQTAAEY
ncbi:ABC transporter substrate-binding protein [Rhodoligotrophos defluvii]|uniref:ABC transporter substrate-binding protein n=1 Tax=Rhodoligotrophos defluvii TaxID=2561934 RepID=UPI0010C93856|nr:ABC transporter substrate-binding protein [Rhodoligotrophos defluvii]